jgi:hypothetical protein
VRRYTERVLQSPRGHYVEADCRNARPVIHGYDKIDWQLVWRTATEEMVPRLLRSRRAADTVPAKRSLNQSPVRLVAPLWGFQFGFAPQSVGLRPRATHCRRCAADVGMGHALVGLQHQAVTASGGLTFREARQAIWG